MRVLPTILPSSSWWAGTAAVRISMTRDCFSVVTDWAICMPNIIEEPMNSTAKAMPTK